MRKVEGVKVYGLCLERLEYQIKNAFITIEQTPELCHPEKGYLLESYNTSDMDDIVDLLEIYDVVDEEKETIMEKLSEVAYNASLLVGEKLKFDFCQDGDLCIYLIPGGMKKEE